MKDYQKKVLENSKVKLKRVESLTDPNEISRTLKGFIKTEDDRLRIAHNLGASGLWTTASRSFVMDLVVAKAFEAALCPWGGGEFLDKARDGCAVIAVGGYGRCELAPYSDVDLLFLHTGKRALQLKHVLERFLQLLWDAGLNIGHSFRTVNECSSSSRTDPHLMTSLTTTRYLGGNHSLYEILLASLDRDRRKRSDQIVEEIIKERDERYARFGSAVCLQEPNVKESAGGLRDLHTATWLSYARNGVNSLDGMKEAEIISHEEKNLALSAYDFLSRVRYEAHLLVGRKTDRISLDLQPQLAERFGYRTESRLMASEKFMRDYYRQARNLNQFCESVIGRLTEQNLSASRWFRWQKMAKLAEPFSINDGKLHLEGEQDLFRKNPLALFDAFALAQAAEVPLSHNLREIITRDLYVVDREFRSSADAGALFMKLLKRRGKVGFILRLMHDVGFLGRYLPEFGYISLLIQHDLYHHYTIDEHILKAIDALDDLNGNQDKHKAHLCAALDEVQDVAVLYLGVLLHDIGKGRGRGHVLKGTFIAEKICERLQINPEAAQKVILLVKHHLTMSHLSQRRDLSEPNLITLFAKQMGSLDALNMLFLLSYSDMNAVGPGIWSDWKGNLLLELYERARQHLTGEELHLNGGELIKLKQAVLEMINGAFPASEVERHFALLPERYARNFKPEAVARHLKLVDSLESEVMSINWKTHGKSAVEMTIATRDRHALFADIAGTLTTQGTEILSAELNTREDGVAIDVFILRDLSTHQAIEKHRWSNVENALRSAILSEGDIAERVEKWQRTSAPRRRYSASLTSRVEKPPKIVCDNEAAQSSTLVEIRTPDEPGLAYKIASSLAELDLDIVCARISTEKSDALDVFYVVDSEGNKLSAELIRSLELHLMEKLSQRAGVTQRKVKEIIV
jgi:[protein-PII] uridylyltransferase